MEGAVCEACERRRQIALITREILVLSLLAVAALGGLWVTRTVADANSRMRARDAEVWFALGETRRQEGRTADAIAALRRASAMDRNNVDYRLGLTEALSAAGDDDHARQLLLGMRQVAPENVTVNLQLARIEARGAASGAAVGYYQNALHGQWPADQVSRRPLVRVELIRHLLERGRTGQALSELLVLEQDLPAGGPSHTDVGDLFTRAGDPRRGLSHFERALAAAPADERTLALAGEAAFAVGDYTAADRYFRAAPQSAAAAGLGPVARYVLTADPLAPRLTARERRRRLDDGVAHARARLEACAPALGSAPTEASAAMAALSVDLAAFDRALKALPVARTPDVVDDGFRLIWRVEDAAGRVCGPADAFGRAVLLIARRHDVGPA